MTKNLFFIKHSFFLSRALGLLPADGALTVGRGKTFLFQKTAVTPKRKVEKCPGYTCDMPCWQKSRLPYFAPKIQIFGSKKHIFASSGQLEPWRSMFSTRKRCLIGIPIWGYQNFYSLSPKKLDFGPKNGQIWPKTGILGQISAFLAHLI